MEIIENMRKMLDAGIISKEDIERAFPQLAESEDERIRKELISFVNKYYGEETKKEVLAYLEKQKLTNDITESSFRMQECLSESSKPLKIKKNKPAEWSERHIADVFEKVGLAKIVREKGNDALTNAVQSAMIELSKTGHAEWSEEDEDYLMDVKSAVNDYFDEGYAEELCAWLKSLRPQPHWKPSKEQMEALNAINCHGALSYVGQQEHLISLYNDIKKL